MRLFSKVHEIRESWWQYNISIILDSLYFLEAGRGIEKLIYLLFQEHKLSL